MLKFGTKPGEPTQLIHTSIIPSLTFLIFHSILFEQSDASLKGIVPV